MMTEPLSEIPDPGAREFRKEDDYTARGEKAGLPVGIVFRGYWRIAADGVARHTRETVKALVKAGVPIHLQSVTAGSGIVNDELPEDVRALEHLTRTTFERNVLRILQVIWTRIDGLKQQVLPPSTPFISDDLLNSVLSRTIVYTVWERDRVEKDEVELLNKLGQVWVTNQDTKKAFLRSGVLESKLRVVPYCYDPDDYLIDPDPEQTDRLEYFRGPSWLSFPRAVTGEVPPGRRFYHIGKWEIRKDHHRMIGCFLKAFKPTEDASLFIKTSPYPMGTSYSSPEESVAYWLSDPTVQKQGWTTETFPKRVRILQKKLSERDILELHRKNNIYLSIGHCEGWDIPAFEAKQAGNRLVYTDYGGPPEFASASDIALPWKFVTIDRIYQWDKAQWAHVDTHKIIDALRAVKPPERRIQEPRLYRTCGRVPAGLRMKQYIQELLAEVEPGLVLDGSMG